MTFYLACLKEFAEFANTRDRAANIAPEKCFTLPYRWAPYTHSCCSVESEVHVDTGSWNFLTRLIGPITQVHKSQKALIASVSTMCPSQASIRIPCVCGFSALLIFKIAIDCVFRIENDKVEGLTITQSFNRQEKWTKALKYTLCNLKWALYWLIGNTASQPASSPSSTGGQSSSSSQSWLWTFFYACSLDLIVLLGTANRLYSTCLLVWIERLALEMGYSFIANSFDILSWLNRYIVYTFENGRSTCWGDCFTS